MDNKENNLMEMNLHVIEHNGKPALQFRKLVTLTPKNENFFNKILEASFSENPPIIMAPVSIVFKDKLKAKLTLKKLGFLK